MNIFSTVSSCFHNAFHWLRSQHQNFGLLIHPSPCYFDYKFKKQSFTGKKKEKKKSCLTINLVHLEFKNKVFIYLFIFFMEQKTCQEPLFLQVRTKIHRSVCKKTSLRYRHNVTLFPFPQFLTNMWLTTPSFLLIHKHPLS